MKKYLVTRTVTVTVSSIIESEMDSDVVEYIVDNEMKSLAGELSNLGLANRYKDVKYKSGDSTVTEI